MSKQLAISSAISIMAMAIVVLYGPGIAQHVPQQDVTLHLPQLIGLNVLLPN